MTAPVPSVSLVIPTRERAAYLRFALQTCLDNPDADLEVLVLDNASEDDTAAVVAAIDDPRLRYLPSDTRLSMRDNFERGLKEARGSWIGFIGDDDGVFAFTVARLKAILAAHPQVDAVAAARAHYFWPDLLASRRGIGLLPRRSGVEVRRSRAALRGLLADDNYYDLPCLYHGFVRRSVVERIAAEQGRFFLSAIVDVYSSIALGAADIAYAYSRAPLFINGGSQRSNGASLLGGGGKQERANWQKEQEQQLGFLPGFDGFKSVGSLIVESALRYCAAHPGETLADLFPFADVARALEQEAAMRAGSGRPEADQRTMFETAGVPAPVSFGALAGEPMIRRRLRQVRSLAENRPIDLVHHGVTDVLAASRQMADMLGRGATGLFHSPTEQLRVAKRIALG